MGPMDTRDKVVILLSGEVIGQGDPELGGKLLVNLLHALEVEKVIHP